MKPEADWSSELGSVPKMTMVVEVLEEVIHETTAAVGSTPCAKRICSGAVEALVQAAKRRTAAKEMRNKRDIGRCVWWLVLLVF